MMCMLMLMAMIMEGAWMWLSAFITAVFKKKGMLILCVSVSSREEKRWHSDFMDARKHCWLEYRVRSAVSHDILMIL